MFKHYNATIIQIGWFNSPLYKTIIRRKINIIRLRDYEKYAAITIQCAWFKSRLYKRLFIREINKLMNKLDRLDRFLLDYYINGIERIIYSDGFT